MHILEMAALDGLPCTAAHKKDSDCTTSSTSPNPSTRGPANGTPPAEVSSRALYSVFAVLGAFLVVSVVGAAVTFVETQAKERNMTSPAAGEFVQFANTSLWNASARSATSARSVLTARMARALAEATARSARYDDVLREHSLTIK
ncbi:unnamed protein product [Ixodes persulcatus]